MPVLSTNESDDTQSTIHYAKPVILATMNLSTSPGSSTQPSTTRSPNIRYPTVFVNNISNNSSPKSCPPYAIPTPRHPHYSTSQLQYEHIRHRCKMLDDENQKLMRMQSDVVNDANRRVQMHINEIRMLKEENKKLKNSNKELRDLCCFLDDGRQKTRKLAKEWQKFGRYTSNLMKQEIQSYHQKLLNIDEKLELKEREVDELRQLCMYLDEQRQFIFNKNIGISPTNQNLRSDDESEDLGCGSSERSEESNDVNKDFCYNETKENTLRLITEQMATSMISSKVSDEERREESQRERIRLLGYIQSLENRIKHLEMTQNHESFWTSTSNVASDYDERTIIERSWLGEDEEVDEEKNNEEIQNLEDFEIEKKKEMEISMTSSSCTTYASSGTDAESVFIMGDVIEINQNLEVRTLSRIEEEGEKTISIDISEENEILKESAKMPPKIGPLSCSSLLSVTNSVNSPTLMRSSSETYRSTTGLISGKKSVRCLSVENSN